MIILTNILLEKEWDEFSGELKLKLGEYASSRKGFFNWKSWVKNSDRDQQIKQLNDALIGIEGARGIIETPEETFQTAKMTLLMTINRLIAEIEEEKSTRKSTFLFLLKEAKTKYSSAVKQFNSDAKTHRVVEQLINPKDFESSEKYKTENSIFYFCFEQDILNRLKEFNDVEDIKKAIQDVIDQTKTRDQWIVFLHEKIKTLSVAENKNNELISYLKYKLSQYRRELSYRAKTANDKSHLEYEISRISVEKRFDRFCEELKTSGLEMLKKQHSEGWVLPSRGQKKHYMYEDGVYIREDDKNKAKYFFIISPELKQKAVENLLDGQPWSLKNFNNVDPKLRQKFIDAADDQGEIAWKNPEEHARRGDIIYPVDKHGKKIIPIAVYVDNKGGGVEPGDTRFYVDVNCKKAIAYELNKTKKIENLFDLNDDKSIDEAFEKLSAEEREELTTTLYNNWKNGSSDDVYIKELRLMKQDYKDPKNGFLDRLRGKKVTIDYHAALKSGAVRGVKKKSGALGEVVARGYREGRKNTRDNENGNAVGECLAGDVTNAWGVRVQKQQLIEGSYKDGHVKLMTDSEWNKKIKCFSDESSEFKMTGGSPSNGNYIVKKGQQKSTNEIKNFFEYFSLFVLQGDYDGFKDSNKAYIKNEDGSVDLFCIDLGHVFRGRSPLVDTLTDSLRVKPSSKFKNFSIFNDSPLSERMKGIHYLRKLRFGINPSKEVLESYDDDFRNKLAALKPGSDLKKFDDYADYFSSKAVLAEEPEQKASYRKIVDGVEEAKRNYLKDCNAMLAVFKSKKLDKAAEPYISRLDLTVEELNLVDSFEKFSSETSEYSPDGKIELQHLDVKYESRVAWQLIKPAKEGDNYQFIGTVPQGIDEEEIKKDLNSYLELSFKSGDIKNQGEMVSVSIPKDQITDLMKRMSEEKIREHKKLKKLTEQDKIFFSAIKDVNLDEELAKSIKKYLDLINEQTRKISFLERIPQNFASSYINNLSQKEQLKIYRGMQPHTQYKFFTEGFMSLEGQLDYLKRRNKIFEADRRASLKGDDVLKLFNEQGQSTIIHDESSALLKSNIGEIVDEEKKLILLNYIQENVKEKNLHSWKDVIDELYTAESKKLLDKYSGFLKEEYLEILRTVTNNMFSLQKNDIESVCDVFDVLKSKQVKPALINEKNNEEEIQIIDKIEEKKIIIENEEIKKDENKLRSETNSKKLDSNKLLLDMVKSGFNLGKGKFQPKSLSILLVIFAENLDWSVLDPNGKNEAKNLARSLLHYKNKMWRNSIVQNFNEKDKEEDKEEDKKIEKITLKKLQKLETIINYNELLDVEDLNAEVNIPRNSTQKNRLKKNASENRNNSKALVQSFSKNKDENKILNVNTETSINKKDEKNNARGSYGITSFKNFFIACLGGGEESEDNAEKIKLIERYHKKLPDLPSPKSKV
jgi:hypothetical protein